MPFIDELLKYKNEVFLETGTYQGDTVLKIANSDSFKFAEIISLELSKDFFKQCTERFKNEKRIHIYSANSKTDLWDILRDIPVEITFWLDSHWSGVPNVGCDSETKCPVLFELEQIKKHPIKSHVIIIDDIRLMDGDHFPVTLPEILNKLYEINPLYKIKFYDDYCARNDILVACLNKD